MRLPMMTSADKAREPTGSIHETAGLTRTQDVRLQKQRLPMAAHLRHCGKFRGSGCGS